MKKPAVYVLDSDVFIAAKNLYYAFDICPGFWESILQAYQHDRVRSIDRAKAKFATEADGWLVAYSMVHGTTVVTNEQPSPESRKRVLLPDVFAQFKVSAKDTFTMLRSLAVKFDLRAKGAA